MTFYNKYAKLALFIFSVLLAWEWDAPHFLSTWLGVIFISLVGVAAITDFMTRLIANWVNLGAFIAVIAFDILALHNTHTTYAPLWGWATHALIGGWVGVSIIFGMRLLGGIIFKREAMGFGDILLARALGAALFVLPTGQKWTWLGFVLWIFASALFGIVLTLIFHRPNQNETLSENSNVTAPFTMNFAKELQDFCKALVLWDAIEEITWFYRTYILKQNTAYEEPEEGGFERWNLPFGPSLVLSFFLVAVFGSDILTWYMKFSTGPSIR